MRPIDADKLEAKCKEIIAQEREYGTATVSWAHAYESFLDMLETTPTIDTQRWHPASEPPEKNEDESVNCVLVTDGYIQHMAYFVDRMWVFCESGQMKEKMFYEVTHWMPLPEAPKEGE